MTTWTLAQNWDAGSRRSSIEGRQDSRRNTASLLLVAVFERERPEDSILTIAGSTMKTWTLAQNWDAGSRRSSIEGRQDSRRSTASLLLVAVFEKLEGQATGVRNDVTTTTTPRPPDHLAVTVPSVLREVVKTMREDAAALSTLEPEAWMDTRRTGHSATR